jgi:hypothetical protein
MRPTGGRLGISFFPAMTIDEDDIESSEPVPLEEEVEAHPPPFPWKGAMSILLLFTAALSAWYFVFRSPDRLEAHILKLRLISDTLSIKLTLRNLGKRPTKVFELQSIFYLSDRNAEELAGYPHPNQLTLPITLGPGDSETVTLLSQFNPDLYFASCDTVTSMGHIRHLAKIGVAWAVSDGRGTRFINWAPLGGIVLDTTHLATAPDTVWSPASRFRRDSIDLLTQYYW